MAMTNLTDWETFVKDLTISIIVECKEHVGKPTDIIKGIVKDAVSEKIRGELIEAIKGTMEIPAEIKEAGVEGWFEFVTNVITQVPEFIEAFQTKPVEVVETPVTPSEV